MYLLEFLGVLAVWWWHLASHAVMVVCAVARCSWGGHDWTGLLLDGVCIAWVLVTVGASSSLWFQEIPFVVVVCSGVSSAVVAGLVGSVVLHSVLSGVDE